MCTILSVNKHIESKISPTYPIKRKRDLEETWLNQILIADNMKGISIGYNQ